MFTNPDDVALTSSSLSVWAWMVANAWDAAANWFARALSDVEMAVAFKISWPRREAGLRARAAAGAMMEFGVSGIGPLGSKDAEKGDPGVDGKG